VRRRYPPVSSPIPARVLICDESAFVRGLIAGILRRAGHEVVGEAANGVEAVYKYRALRPDLVTLDIIMPELGGLEAVRAIVGTDPAARVLVCSGMAQRALVMAAFAAGAREFVAKPFQPARVLEAVHRALGAAA
jgi:two-component system, chemotaxis family, chemotaxis protein CheY